MARRAQAMEAARRGRSLPMVVLVTVGAACALCGMVVWSSLFSASVPAGTSSLAISAAEPASAPSTAFYVPQLAVPKMQALVPQMAVPRAPQVPKMQAMPEVPEMQTMPEVPKMQTMPVVQQGSEMPQMAEMPSVMAMPTAEEPASPLAFLGSFAGGLLAGAAFVHSLLKKTGHKVPGQRWSLPLLISAATAAAVTFQPAAAHASVDQVTNLVATSSSDFGGSTIPLIGLGVLAATIALLAGPVED